MSERTLSAQILSARSDAYHRAHGVARRLALRNSATRLQAEDVAQGVCERMARLHRRTGSLPDNPEAWATTVAQRLIMNEADRARVRRRARRPDHGAPAPRAERVDEEGYLLEDGPAAFRDGVPMSASQPPIQRLLARQLLRRLGWGPREVSLMVLVGDGVAYAEIADWLGYASAAVVKTTVSRLRRQALVTIGGREALQDWLGQQRPY